MRLTPDEKRIIERMAPGAICRHGLLCGDRRSLQDILHSDSASVESLGLTHEIIADGLDALLRRVTADLGRTVRIDRHVTATARESMGRIACPWAGCGLFPKGQVDLTDARTGTTVHVTPLSVHMIRRHGFYQGKGSEYRLDPAVLARMIDLASGQD